MIQRIGPRFYKVQDQFQSRRRPPEKSISTGFITVKNLDIPVPRDFGSRIPAFPGKPGGQKPVSSNRPP